MRRGRSLSSVLLTFMVIISVNGSGNVKTCCQEVIIQLRQTRDSRSEGGKWGEVRRRRVEIVRAVVVVIAAVEGLHRINVVLQHADA